VTESGAQPAEAAQARAAAGGAAVRTTTADECAPNAAMLARAFSFLGKRWNAMILGQLSDGPAGFRDLSRAIGGISDSVLSGRLADLTAGGLIDRTVSEGPPLAVSYQLTERGGALMPALEQIAAWARDNLPAASC
jgi:DNA-binding HxlR family transcriptional regulator